MWTEVEVIPRKKSCRHGNKQVDELVSAVAITIFLDVFHCSAHWSIRTCSCCCYQPCCCKDGVTATQPTLWMCFLLPVFIYFLSLASIKNFFGLYDFFPDPVLFAFVKKSLRIWTETPKTERLENSTKIKLLQNVWVKLLVFNFSLKKKNHKTDTIKFNNMEDFKKIIVCVGTWWEIFKAKHTQTIVPHLIRFFLCRCSMWSFYTFIGL